MLSSHTDQTTHWKEKKKDEKSKDQEDVHLIWKPKEMLLQTIVIKSSYFNTTKLQQTHVVLFIWYEKAFPQKYFAYQTTDNIPSCTVKIVENQQVLTLILLLVPYHIY